MPFLKRSLGRYPDPVRGRMVPIPLFPGACLLCVFTPTPSPFDTYHVPIRFSIYSFLPTQPLPRTRPWRPCQFAVLTPFIVPPGSWREQVPVAPPQFTFDSFPTMLFFRLLGLVRPKANFKLFPDRFCFRTPPLFFKPTCL